jgi:hypothetical protein
LEARQVTVQGAEINEIRRRMDAAIMHQAVSQLKASMLA